MRHVSCGRIALVCAQDHIELKIGLRLNWMLTHGVCVFAGHLVVANFYGGRNVLSVVCAEARKVFETLLSVGLFSSCMFEVVSRLN